MKSQLTTLCYIEKGEKYLMLHRVSKKNDINKDKWIGVGGHFEGEESPEECLLREVYEETGLTLTSYQFRGIVTFCRKETRQNTCAFTLQMALRENLRNVRKESLNGWKRTKWKN